MQRQLDRELDVFRCHFTGVALVIEGNSHRAAEWAHLTPGDESSVVLACKLINRMQSDLTEPEFRMLVKELAASFAGEPFDESAFPPR
jgi:hypothetical protein